MSNVNPKLDVNDSVLLVIDVQEKLLNKVTNPEQIQRNISFLLEAATILSVPILVTEQYPKGLGQTVDSIRKFQPQTLIVKTAFSCVAALGFIDTLRSLDRRHVVLCGLESHVCVLQTALDLIDQFELWIPVDAIASRHTIDHDMSLSRMREASAILTTCESVAFEWIRDSNHPHFKAISQLVIQRARHDS